MYKLGEVFQVSIFGESHGDSIGLMISGIAPGIKIDHESIQADLSLRRPRLKSESPRQESDDYKIISGVFKGYTTGTPLVITLENNDVSSSSYDILKTSFRPSHADYPADVHYGGYQDYRGGGSFSGRLTVALVIAGSIAKSILKNFDVDIETHIKQVDGIYDDKFDDSLLPSQIETIRSHSLHMINDKKQDEVLDYISKVRDKKDSRGAKLETVVLNLEAGLGEPFFNKLDATLSKYIMSIPSIKGVSFGDGFDYVDSFGSEVLDEYYYDQSGKVKTYANHNGGIVGGLSTGMPILINTIVKPTPTIAQPVRTIHKETKENIEILVKGRHDSSIFTRIPVVINSMVALALVDMYSMRYGILKQRGDQI